jgi:phage shock protein A
MGIFSRFTDIVNANLNSILDKAEDPEKLVRLMIQEMQDTLVEVRSAAARAIADRKDLTRKLQALDEEMRDWEAKAELALDRGRDDLAKAALAEKTQLARTAETLATHRAAVDDGLARLNDDIARLENKLADARTRQKAIIARHQTVSRRLQVRERLHDNRIDDALMRFERFEQRVDEIEGRVEAYDLGARKSLHQEFSELEASEAVEQELAALKSRRASGRDGGSDGERG